MGQPNYAMAPHAAAVVDLVEHQIVLHMRLKVLKTIPSAVSKREIAAREKFC